MKRPMSFTLLGLYLGWEALSGFLLAIGARLEPIPDRGPQGLPLLTTVFAAVAAEALWRCRPWCVRATIGYFAVSILAPLAASAATGGLMPGEVVFSILGKLIFVAMPVLYVNHRASQIFAPSPAPVAIPAPRP
ncbi:MAG TPA: hypothetical protein VGO40_18580 [Longimicrobium sp.]|jgi:hypothetical protein|nr:hypothetical protein [Longimicrobium sp.]